MMQLLIGMWQQEYKLTDGVILSIFLESNEILYKFKSCIMFFCYIRNVIANLLQITHVQTVSSP